MTTALVSAAARTLVTARLRKRHADARTPDIFTGELSTPTPPVAAATATPTRTPRRRGHPKTEAATEAGMLTALEHAELVDPGWKQSARAFVELFARKREPFIVPDLRDYAYAAGLPEPPKQCAWGGVVYKARRDGIIKPAGIVDYGNDTMHTRVVRQWVGA